MKIFSLLFFCYVMQSHAAITPDSLLTKMMERLNGINSGQYRIDYSIKYFAKNEPYKCEAMVLFERQSITKDSSIFKYILTSGNLLEAFDSDFRYVVNYIDTNRTVDVYDIHKNPDDIYGQGSSLQSLKYSYFFRQVKPFFLDPNYDRALELDTTISGDKCYTLHITGHDQEEDEIKNYHKRLFIRQSDCLPVGYTESMDYMEYTQVVTSFIQVIDLNNTQVNFNPDTIAPGFSREMYEYEPFTIDDLLKPGDTIPYWKLKTHQGDEMQSDKLPSEYVFIDFWYRSCAPCVQAMPDLQKLYQEFGSKGLTILGINPKDTNDNELNSFLQNRNITYPILVGEGTKEVAKDYMIQVYPTYYLVDRTGVILYSGFGYGKGSEEVLRDVFIEKIK